MNLPASRNLPGQDLAAQLRRALRRTAQPITILTSRDSDSAPHGIAASAVISVSMDPPSMVVSVNRSASIHPVLAKTGAFCINVLHTDQSGLVEAFARSDQREQRFLSADWLRGPRDLPYLRSAQAAIFCATELSVDYATHTLCIGSVIEVRTFGERLPLLWFDGAFAGISPPAIPSAND